MITIRGRNVNEVYGKGLSALSQIGVMEESRNGVVIVAPCPVVSVYERPMERVLFSPARDANPFFHLMECLWMMAGRNDAEFLTQFNSGMKQYARPDGRYDGAYGYRWRYHFMRDQINFVINELQERPNSRRAVIAMWDPKKDTDTASLDIPCNTTMFFLIRGGRLELTVCNRSNDALWGAYGANAVHMSFLQEYIAAQLDIEVGTYHQFSNNFHVYTGVKNHEELLREDFSPDLYAEMGWKPYSICNDPAHWMQDLNCFMENPQHPFQYHNWFFYHVARPMYNAWQTRKTDLDSCYSWIEQIEDNAWRHVCLNWISRRVK